MVSTGGTKAGLEEIEMVPAFGEYDWRATLFERLDDLCHDQLVSGFVLSEGGVETLNRRLRCVGGREVSFPDSQAL